MINYLEKLKEKCNLNNDFIQIVEQIFNKLHEFGYISRRQIPKLERKLYNNIDIVILGKKDSLDYKSGYYDAIKKELYIKDISNTKAFYLRIIYILTTTEISENNFNVGYSNAILSTSSYKIMHTNFGINRAIVSNLVCRLLYTVPTTLSIMPTYRTYNNDFLGNKIVSNNDIYFLEGKLLSQLCYALNFDEENLYNNLFNNPQRYLNRLMFKCSIEKPDEFLKTFDKTSRLYSNYNKLIYLNKSLNDNYLNIKRNILNADIANNLKTKQERIHLAIRNALIPLVNIDEDDEALNTNIESYLSEEINKLEETIILNIVSIQETFVDVLLSLKTKFSTIVYAIKLKKLEKLLIVENDKLNNAISNTIFLDLLNSNENTSSNLIEKIKYSLANEILANEKYITSYKSLNFNVLNDISTDTSALVALTLDNTFIQLIQIDNLNFAIKSLKQNTNIIHLDNMNYLLNNNTLNSKIDEIENIFTSIKQSFEQFYNVSLNNIFMCKINELSLIVIIQDTCFSILKLNETIDNKIKYSIEKLSENYCIFNTSNNSNLPVLYRKKESFLQRIFSNFIEE